MKNYIQLVVTYACFCMLCSNVNAQKTFVNPLLPSGADPWCTYKDGYYYYTNTTGNNITIWKTKNIATLATSEKKVVWTPPKTGPYSREIWAPEIHYFKKKWYVYFAADSGNNNDHRLWVLENSSNDPLQGEWKLKGKLTTPEDKWSIDGSAMKYKGKLYFIWSGWQGDKNGEQDIYIAAMKNPWTITGKRTKVSSPQYDWELNGELHNANDPGHIKVNEGPEFLVHNNKIFLIYSASGCWTDFYALGMLTADTNADLLDSASWKKSSQPVFQLSKENKVFAPGHNCFFVSPDGKEDWILYHANNEPGQGCGGYRSPRAQKFTWNDDDTPNFGTPVPVSVALPVPSE
jgi:GH43 family beta-xylosidase